MGSLTSIIAILIKYGPTIIGLVEQGIKAEQAAAQAAPDLIPHLEALIKDFFPTGWTGQTPTAGDALTVALAILKPHPQTQAQVNDWMARFGAGNQS